MSFVVKASVFDDRKSKSCAAKFFAAAFIHAKKAFKNAAVVFFFDAYAAIFDGEFDGAVLPFKWDFDKAIWFVVFYGIIAKVENEVFYKFINAKKLLFF